MNDFQLSRVGALIVKVLKVKILYIYLKYIFLYYNGTSTLSMIYVTLGDSWESPYNCMNKRIKKPPSDHTLALSKRHLAYETLFNTQECCTWCLYPNASDGRWGRFIHSVSGRRWGRDWGGRCGGGRGSQILGSLWGGRDQVEGRSGGWGRRRDDGGHGESDWGGRGWKGGFREWYVHRSRIGSSARAGGHTPHMHHSDFGIEIRRGRSCIRHRG